MDPRSIVRAWYEAESHRYRSDDAGTPEYLPWLRSLEAELPPGGDVLDLGCGCGHPTVRYLSERGFRVTGVDISQAQVIRARRLVPEAIFMVADMSRLEFSPGVFDGVVCLYALIHVPVEEHPGVIQRIHGWLRPGGVFLAMVGWKPWTGVEQDWLGSGRPQYWSHGGRDDYARWIQEAGFELVDEQVVPEGDGAHALMLARA